MTGIIRRDVNELRYNSIWLLTKEGNNDYYRQLLRNARALFYGMGQQELIDALDKEIKEKIEDVMGTKINNVFLAYKNLPYLNSFTRSKNPVYADINIYKYTIEQWLDELEDWIFKKAIELEPDIRFTLPSRQFI